MSADLYPALVLIERPFLSMWRMFQGVNPDVRYEVQYSSYVNVTAEGFVILKRVVKTESFALQVTWCNTQLSNTLPNMHERWEFCV